MPDPSPALIDIIARAIHATYAELAQREGYSGTDLIAHLMTDYDACQDAARAALDALPTPIGYGTMRPGRESVDNECDYLEDMHNYRADAEESAHICRAIYGAGRVVALVPVGDDHA